jgi:hypothetical protein
LPKLREWRFEMSWIQKLYETYDLCVNAPQFEKDPLLPVSHTEQQAHIEIIVDQSGNFQRAAVVARENTVFPATEDSAGRTNKPVPHPICDKIQYCAADYKEFGGRKSASSRITFDNFGSGRPTIPTPRSVRYCATSRRRASWPIWFAPEYCIAAPTIHY